MSFLKRTGCLFLVVLFLFSSLGGAYTQQSSYTVSQEDYDKLMTIFKALDSKFQLQTSLLTALQQDKKQLTEQLAQSQMDIKELTILKDSLLKEISEKQNLVISLQAELIQSKLDWGKFQQQWAVLDKTLTDLQSQYKEVVTLYDKALKSWQDYKEQAQKQIDDLKMQRNIAIGTSVVELAIILLFIFLGGRT